MEPFPARLTTGYLSYLITGQKNPDMVVPDKCVSELLVPALQAQMTLVAYGSHSSACVVSEALWGDSHTPLFFPPPAISGYVLPPFSSPAFWHLGVEYSHTSVPSVLSVLLK